VAASVGMGRAGPRAESRRSARKPPVALKSPATRTRPSPRAQSAALAAGRLPPMWANYKRWVGGGSGALRNRAKRWSEPATTGPPDCARLRSGQLCQKVAKYGGRSQEATLTPPLEFRGITRKPANRSVEGPPDVFPLPPGGVSHQKSRRHRGFPWAMMHIDDHRFVLGLRTRSDTEAAGR
jgi:hypothetical protein